MEKSQWGLDCREKGKGADDSKPGPLEKDMFNSQSFVMMCICIMVNVGEKVPAEERRLKRAKKNRKMLENMPEKG